MALEKIQREHGITAWKITEPDRPGLYVLVYDATGERDPVDPENGLMLFTLCDDDCVDPLWDSPREFEGRADLLKWYVENVGYDPDADNGAPLPIEELVDSVASHFMLWE